MRPGIAVTIRTVLCAAGLPALAAGTNDLALAEAVRAALRDNPELRSLQLTWEALQERSVPARSLPNPMVRLAAMDAADGGRWRDAGEQRFMVEQEFPWFGKRQLREDIARQEAEVARQEAAAMRRDLTLLVQDAYFDLYGVQRALALVRAEGDTLRRMVSITETMYANGERSQQDVLKAKAEIPMLQQRVLDLETQENTLKARLNLLLNRPVEAPIGAVVTPPATNVAGRVETFLALAATRPEVQAAEAQVRRYELEGRLMEKEAYPDYRLGAEYRQVGNGDNMIMLSIGFDLPIRTSKYEAGVREAGKRKAASEATRQSEVRKSAFDVQDAWFKWQSARATLALYRDRLIPQAVARFEASEAGYRTGKVDFMDLLESQRFLLTARTMAAMTEGSTGIQAARLERAVGMALQSEPAAGDDHGKP